MELTNTLLDDFLKTDSLPAARRVLTDLELTAVQGATGVTGLWEPNPNRAAPSRYRAEVIALEIRPDQVHLLVEVDPPIRNTPID